MRPGTLPREGSLAVLLETKWDVIGISQVRRTEEGFNKLNGGIFCATEDLKEKGTGQDS